MYTRFLNFCCICSCFIAFTSCEPNAAELTKKLAYMDITDASCIFIAPKQSNTNKMPAKFNDSGSNTISIFKITEEGVIQEVILQDDNGREITQQYHPIKLIPIEDSPYIFAFFTVGTFVVNKSTGAVYDCSQLNIDGPEYGCGMIWKNQPIATSDKYGNIYYGKVIESGCISELHKIDVSDPNSLTDEIITPAGGVYLKGFTVSKDGEVMFADRLRTKIGKFIAYRNNAQLPFCGLDGRIHFFTSSNRTASDAHVAINFHEDGNYSVDTLGFIYFNDIYDLGYVSGGFSPYIIKLPNMILAIGSRAQVFGLDNKDHLCGYRSYGLDNFSVSDLHYNNSYIYCSGQTAEGYKLIKIDVNTFATKTVFENEDYEIYSFIVDNQGNIQFNGSRISDGKNVIASIDPSGQITILSVSADQEKITLIRIQ